MVNWSKPDLETAWDDFPGEIRAMGEAVATQNFDSDTNIPTGAIRYSTTKVAWERYSGSAWVRIFPLVGSQLLLFSTSTPTGYVPLEGGTIGSASSGGTALASADAEELFTHLWTNLADAQAPVSGGRGASAAADFAANKTLTLPDTRQKMPISKAASGTGSVLGGTGGTIDHVHTGPAHTHPLGSSAYAEIGYDFITGLDTLAYNKTTATSYTKDAFVRVSGAETGVSDAGNTEGVQLGGTTDSSGTGNTGTANPPFYSTRVFIKI